MSYVFSIEPATKKQRQRRYSVSDLEVDSILEAYQINSGLGWPETLQYVKNKLREEVKGNPARWGKIVEYYLQYSTDKSALKRIQRIVAQSVHEVNKCAGESSHSCRMYLVIKENKTRYSSKRAPEERQLTKFNQAANLSESSLSIYEDYDRYPESYYSLTQGSACHLLKKPSTSTASGDKNKREIPRLKKSKRANAGKLKNEPNKNTLQFVTRLCP